MKEKRFIKWNSEKNKHKGHEYKHIDIRRNGTVEKRKIKGRERQTER